MRSKLITAFASVAVAAVAAASGAHAADPSPVKVGDDFFKPTRLTVSKGTTVTWKWTGKHRHSVTELKNRFGSKVKRKGTYDHKFRKTGKFTIYCKVHPLDMRMKVTVK